MSFAHDSYQVLPQFVDPKQVAFCQQVIKFDAAAGRLQADTTVPGAPAGRDNGMLQRLQEMLRPRLEEITGKRLFRTYVYYRIYQRGNTLHKHRDRPACEYSITLNLGGASDVDWPIFVKSRGHEVPVHLSPGDAMLYKGCEVLHWRETYTGDEQVQAFLHYVDQDGPYADHKDDAIDGAIDTAKNGAKNGAA
ncbi:hypothetical protein A8B78_14460 [Jannaschia sp. EhC01]|nr:hypothetical protein A8B78_14460 [Jannaschia sp. EhC01]